MKEGSRANALLVELLLVIFFFMIGSTILIRLFADARHKSLQARAATLSITEAQNIAELLYSQDDPQTWLARNGFTQDSETEWSRRDSKYTFYVKDVTDQSLKTEAGVVRTFTISAVGDGQNLFTLPSSRYMPAPAEPKEVSP